MNNEVDQIQSLFEDEEKRYQDGGFSENVALRLNRRRLVRALILMGASALGFALFIFQFMNIGPLILRKIDLGLLVVEPSVMGIFFASTSLVIPIAVVGYILSTTITMLFFSMSRSDHAR